MSIVVRYLVALIVLVGGDFVWLGYFGVAGVFQRTVGPIMGAHTVWPAAIAFYPLYAVGIVVFVVSPALARRAGLHALLYGFLFGFMAYMTYDLTNLATIGVWTVKLAAMDMAWGTFITGLAAYVSFAVTRAISRA